MRRRNLVLLTDEFPFGTGEQFLETEIIILAEHFENVFIYPYRLNNGAGRLIPENVKVVEMQQDLLFSARRLILRNWMIIFKVFLSEFSRRKFYKIKGYKYHFNKLVADLNNAQQLNNELLKLKDIQVYSYWFGRWGSLMSLVNVLSHNRIKFITRVHGFDYDVNRWENKFIPFRKFQMKHVAQIFPVSQFAVNRLNSEYPKNNNVELQRLGVSDHGDNPIANEEVLTIVSCSSLIELKRVHLIIEILKFIKIETLWVHFGSGPLLENIKKISKELPNNIKVEFRGHVQNSDILKYYKSKPIDLFINVSELEGVPVSLMEAISFGIPIIGCNICGVPEIVTPETGFLLDKEFDPIAVALIIENFKTSSPQEILKLRESSKLFWRKNYCAEINYKKYVNEVLLPSQDTWEKR